MNAPISLGCARARAALQARLDEDPDAPVESAEIEAHLSGCADCRALARELAEVQDGLRSAPLLAFPDEALESVWDRTVRARPWRRAVAVWGGLAAAGILGALLLATPRGARVPQGPSQQEVLQAAADVRFVLRLTDQQIRSQGTRVLHEVLDDEVAPALRQAERD
jgi:predicted anti-sigma-YlaC factor YlaD